MAVLNGRQEKLHECSNIGKVLTSGIIVATVYYVASSAGFKNSRPLEFCWTECTRSADLCFTQTTLYNKTAICKLRLEISCNLTKKAISLSLPS